MKKGVYHFIGMGGIGMSALARILLQKGCVVQGSDVKISPLLDELQKEGAKIQIGHTKESVAMATTVVYSSDIKEDNVELERAKELKLPLLHRSDLLNQLMAGKKALLVTGSHGKTTTTALLASVLKEGRLDPSFVVGGIHLGWKTNGGAGEGPFFVAEADESDGSFLKTASYGAIVTNLDQEHLNFWKTEEALAQAFQQFFSQASHPEHLFWCGDDANLRLLQPKGISYGFGKNNPLRILSCEVFDRGIRFDLEWKGKRYEQIELALFGRHNGLNGAAVFGLGISLGIKEEDIRKAFREFAGTGRRLEKKGEAHGVEIYDDYGHHPVEIEATLAAIRDKVREKRLVALFQPHRYTRVQDLFDRFVICFDEADLVVMTDIYAAGEAPIEGITSAALYSKMRERLGARLHFYPRTHLETGAASLLMPHDVVIAFGAGDISKACEPILHLYQERAPKWNVGVLFGGTSAEHEVSILSAQNIIRTLDPAFYNVRLFGITKNGEWVVGNDAVEKLKQKITFAENSPKISPEALQELSRCDIAVPMFHGPQGEDGMFQGLLDALDVAYVGCDYRASALCMQKAWTKHIAILAGVPTPPYVEMDRTTYRKNRDILNKKIDETLHYPVWVKAVHLGSSIGVSRAARSGDLHKAAELSFAYDDALIVEQEIEGRQIEFSVLGNEYIRVAPPGEILNEGAFYDYDKKYGAAACGVDIPAKLTPTQLKLGEELAIAMYRASGCKGLARIDFFFDRSGHFWLNEINPMPGFTSTSGFPKMWEAAGLNGTKLMDDLVVLALHKQRRLREIRGK